MKLKFSSPGEREQLVGLLGLSESATEAELGAAVAARLTTTPAPAASPDAQASAAAQPASGPTDYPEAWLSPSDLAPWPRPMPSHQRVTVGGD